MSELVIKNQNLPSVSPDGVGSITFETEGLEFGEVRRLQQMLHTIIMGGILKAKSSAMTLHISPEGVIVGIDTLYKWRSKSNSTPL